MSGIYNQVFLSPNVGFDAVRDGRRAPIFYYDVDLSIARSKAAGTHLVVNIAGDSFAADLDPDFQGSATVYFQDTTISGAAPAPVYIAPGQIINAPFTQLLIENKSQPGKRLRFFYGVGVDFQSSTSGQVTVAGTVSIIDGEKARTLTGTQFAGSAISGATAGTYQNVQLWNPAGSGRNLIVRNAAMNAINAGTNTLYHAPASNALANVVSNAIANKFVGNSTASVAEIRVQETGAINSLNGGIFFQTTANGGSAPTIQMPIFGAVVVPPGRGLLVTCTQPASYVTGSWEWFEETA